MSDLFTSLMNSKRGEGIADDDCRMWAERLMRDVNEEVSKEERKERDFIQAWIRWTDLVRLVNFLDLSVYRKENIPAEDLRWHRMLTSGLIALGGALEQWSVSFSPQTLSLASYDPKKTGVDDPICTVVI
ncbi:MAG: hypothetical protein HC845_05140 [Akkermansiaceae bacterium]|nr:hypothetical protein [Akkermansiaceae bacterium]